MTRKIITATVVAAALVGGHVERASADAFVGGLVGGIIGGAIGSNIRTNRTRTRTVRRSGISAATRQLNRDIQTALNHFRFNVGTPDGVLGRQSRAGISQYQGYMDFPVTGRLAEFERTVLITAYQRAMAGGTHITRVISSHRDGVRGLLIAVRDEMTGGPTRTAGGYGLPPEVADAVDEIASSSDPSAEQLVGRSGFVQLADLNGDGRTDYILDTSVTGSAFWCNAQACTVQVFVSTPDGYTRNDFQSNDATPAAFNCSQASCSLNAPGQVTALASATPAGQMAPPVAAAQPIVPNPGAAPVAAAPALAMPNLFASRPAPSVASLSSHCNRVGIVTSTNGGYVTRDSMTDPVFALNEQFCLARGYAIAEGEALLAQVPGATPEAIAQQCAAFGPMLQAQVAQLSTQSRAQVLQSVSSFVLGSGMSADDLRGTARICLSSGYATDSLDVALSASLILVALGDASYGELTGHHLMQGFGTAENRALAGEWLRESVPASEAAATAVAFRPGEPSRAGLIHAAVAEIIGGAVPSATPAPALLPMPTAPAAPAAPPALSK